MLTIVVVVVASGPADATVPGGWFANGATRRRGTGIAGQGFPDEAFEAAFGGVGGRHRTCRQIETSMYCPGPICSTTARMSSMRCRIRGQDTANNTTIADRLSARCC